MFFSICFTKCISVVGLHLIGMNVAVDVVRDEVAVTVLRLGMMLTFALEKHVVVRVAIIGNQGTAAIVTGELYFGVIDLIVGCVESLSVLLKHGSVSVN